MSHGHRPSFGHLLLLPAVIVAARKRGHKLTLAPGGDRSYTSRLASSTATHGSRGLFMASTLTRGVKVMDDLGLRARVSRELRNTSLSYRRGGAGCTILLRAEDTHGFGHLWKNEFMLSGSTASVWPDEAGGCHDRDRLPVRSRLALRAQRQWRRQSHPW
jgi:hypothetical protein